MSSKSLAFALALFTAFLAANACFAADNSSKDAKAAASKADLEPYMLEPWDFQDPVKFKLLSKEREDLQLKMYNLRVKLINEDPDLQKLHSQIMALHKELAIQLDNKKDMRKLSEKLRDVDAEIDKLPKKDSSK